MEYLCFPKRSYLILTADDMIDSGVQLNFEIDSIPQFDIIKKDNRTYLDMTNLFVTKRYAIISFEEFNLWMKQLGVSYIFTKDYKNDCIHIYKVYGKN